MAQTTMTDYLAAYNSSPNTANSQSESPVTVTVDQSAVGDSDLQIGSSDHAHQLPIRQTKKSKRIIWAEKKARQKKSQTPT